MLSRNVAAEEKEGDVGAIRSLYILKSNTQRRPLCYQTLNSFVSTYQRTRRSGPERSNWGSFRLPRPAVRRRDAFGTRDSGVSDDRQIVGKRLKDAMPFWNAGGSMKRKTLEQP